MSIFGLLFGVFAIGSKVSTNIQRDILTNKGRKIAEDEGRKWYIDAYGATRSIKGNEMLREDVIKGRRCLVTEHTRRFIQWIDEEPYDSYIEEANEVLKRNNIPLQCMGKYRDNGLKGFRWKFNEVNYRYVYKDVKGEYYFYFCTHATGPYLLSIKTGQRIMPVNLKEIFRKRFKEIDIDRQDYCDKYGHYYLRRHEYEFFIKEDKDVDYLKEVI